jgi:hypothetical protein
MKQSTLPDFLAADLDIVSIGINLSLYSVERGFYFARPGKRFWPALNASGLVSPPVVPSREAVDLLFREHRIGFTDLVNQQNTYYSMNAMLRVRRGRSVERSMSVAQSPRLTLAWLSGLAGILLLAGCAYPYGYGYGGYYYGSSCWPYDCDDWNHRHHRHRHGHDDDDDNGGKHDYRGDTQGDRPRFDPDRHAGDFPRREEPNPRTAEPAGPGRARPPAQSPYWIPQQRDSKN